MRRADELVPEAPKPKRGRPPKAKAQALANYKADDPERFRLVAPIVRPHGIDPARFGLVT